MTDFLNQAPPRMADQRIPKWFDKWVNPTTVLAILGGIVWGVQLDGNIGTLDSRMHITERIVGEHSVSLRDSDLTDTKTVYVLDNLVTRVDDTEAAMERHLSAVRQWETRILHNEFLLEEGRQ